MSQNRTRNTIRNSKSGLILKLINIFGAFLSRTFLIKILGVEYVGLDGLFTSVLTFLNMTELGFSTAIVYKLYKPIAENDTKKVSALMNFYKKVYRYIGAIVLVLGLIILPFIGKFINGNVPDNVNVRVLYLVYLLNTCCSYWLFAYETALLNAQQRNDMVSKVTSIILLTKYILQISLVAIFKNYYVFAIILPVSTLLTNFGIHFIAKKNFPQYVCEGTIEKEDKVEITKKVTALLFNKVGTSIITGSDNIVISYFLGLTILGIYDSYYYIFNMLYGIFAVFHAAVTASVGNSIVLEETNVNLRLFHKLCFLNTWAVGWCSICLLCLYSPFIQLWIGADKSLGDSFAVIMAIYFFLWMSRFIVTIFKSAQGLWWEDRYRALIEGIINLVLNIITVRIIGIYGVTLSTIVAMLLVSIPWETIVLYKKYFHTSPRQYFITYGSSFAIVAIVGVVTYFVSRLFHFRGIVQLITIALICIILPNTIFAAIYWKTDEFLWMKNFIRHRINKILKER